MDWVITVIVLLTVTGALWRAVHGRKRDGFFQAPLLRERIDPLFKPYEGRQPSPDELATLARDARKLFDDIITGLGLIPGEWSLHVHVDELLGPIPQLHGPGGQVVGLGVFERGLVDGSLDLPSG